MNSTNKQALESDLWYLFDSYGHLGVYNHYPILQDAEVILLVAPLSKVMDEVIRIRHNYEGCPTCDRHIEEMLAFYKSNVINEVINEET